MDFAQHVKSSVDIVRVVGEYVRLRKQGTNRHVGLCPFHTEKTPSFSVHEVLQIYKCFGCGKGGDVFNFLMELQGLTFYEALKTLAEQHGIPLPRPQRGDLADADSRRRAALYRIHEIAALFFRERLQAAEGSRARDYLLRRGIDEETASRFDLGFAPAQGQGLLSTLEREGISRDYGEASGLILKRQDGTGFYDRFRERLTFPIAGESGRIIAFGGRRLRDEQQPKYLNSPETPIYTKSAVLYNLHRAKKSMREQNRVVLVEGYTDVIGLARAGISAVVASCGTSLTPRHVRTLRRQVDRVVVNFDPDQAGQNATERSIQLLLQEGLQVRVLTLPEGLDPDEFCERHGADRYRDLLDKAPDYFLWLADRARSQFDVRSPEGRVAAFRLLVPSIHLLPDKIQRAALTNELADHLGVDRGLVLEQLRRAAVERRTPPPVSSSGPGDASPGEKLLLRLLTESEEARKEMLPGVLEIAVREALPTAAILEAVVAVASSGERFQYAAVEGRLGEKDQEFLSRIIFEMDSQPCSLDDGRQAYAALRQMEWEREYRSLRRRIAQAEKSGDRRAAIELLRTKTQLERRLGVE